MWSTWAARPPMGSSIGYTSEKPKQRIRKRYPIRTPAHFMYLSDTELQDLMGSGPIDPFLIPSTHVRRFEATYVSDMDAGIATARAFSSFGIVGVSG